MTLVGLTVFLHKLLHVKRNLSVEYLVYTRSDANPLVISSK